MNISGINVTLTGEDLLSIINEFLKVEGLVISQIKIEDEIKVYGSYSKSIKIDFIAGVKFQRIKDGIIHGEVTSFRIAKMRIFSLVRKFALKYATKSLEEKGITYAEGKVIINLKKMMKDIPYVDLDISDININKNILKLYISNLNISLKGKLNKQIEEEIVEEKEEIAEKIEKVSDYYTQGREYLENRLPNKIKEFSDYLFIIPDVAALVYRLLKDSRVDIKTKLIISGAIAYVSFPTDFIPDNIPFIGKIDDLAVAFFTLDKIISDVPSNIILENWAGKNDLILVMNNVIEYTINFTGAKNVEKLYKFVDEIASL